MFNLDEVAFAEEFEFEVLRPDNGKPSGLKIVLAGPGHSVTLTAQEAELRKKMDDNAVYQKEAQIALKAGKEVPQRIVTMAEFRAGKAASIAARVLRSNEFLFGGNTVTLDAGTANAVFSSPKFYDWIVPQLEAALNDNANFITPSATIS